jgi:choloylglycine hydrolase
MERMTSLRSALIVGAVVFLAGTGTVAACTGLHLGRPSQERLTAVNYDWEVPGGQLVVNTRGLVKNALVDEQATPAAWTSRFGSVTFNQYGREFPIGGMNQMGLVMHVLWLDQTVYRPAGDRPAIGALQWVQHCLDSYHTVDNVVASARDLAISSRAPLHFFACDRTGDCATIEFIAEAMVVHTGDTLPVPVLTNSTYDDSIDALNRSLGYGGEVTAAPEGQGSLDRWVSAALAVNQIRMKASSASVDVAFRLLGEVAQEDLTQWSIVYDQMNGVVHFHTRGSEKRRSVDLRELDLRCLAGAQTLDLEAELSGEVGGSLAPYDAERNLELIKNSVARTEFLASTSESWMARSARYPDQLQCSPAARGQKKIYEDWQVPPVPE